MNTETYSNEWNPTIFQGATWTWQVEMTNPDDTKMNLTGYSVRGQLRRTFDSSTVDLDLTTGSMISISDAANGVISLNVPAATTANLTGTYKWDVELVSGGGLVYRIIQGEITVSREVTR